MRPERKADAIRAIQSMPAEATWKRELLLGWARTVGVRLKRADYQAVEMTGVDR